MKYATWVLPLIFIAALAIADSEVYKWVDENGVVHYSDRPPHHQPGTELELQIEPEADAAPGESVYKDVIERQRALRESRTVKKQARALERKAVEEARFRDERQCAQAIHALNTLKKQCPVFYDGAGILRAQCPGYYYFYEGDRSYVDDEERQELIEHYSEFVRHCREAQGQ